MEDSNDKPAETREQRIEEILRRWLPPGGYERPRGRRGDIGIRRLRRRLGR